LASELSEPAEILAEGFRSGDVRALARAISLVEKRDPSVRALQQALKDRAQAYVVGFTGAPGTGKSTLVDVLVTLLRKLDRSVAVVATDPNSPFSGGAILGDRIRMQRHALDPKVFIRSMGARGHLGGLSLAARETIRLLGAFGFDPVILETVGVGQSELEVAAVADTTIVVLTPNLGDGVQMIKAGILEIADIFVVNKADLEGSNRAVTELRGMLSLSNIPGTPKVWKPPIIATSAARQDGTSSRAGATASWRGNGSRMRPPRSRRKSLATGCGRRWPGIRCSPSAWWPKALLTAPPRRSSTESDNQFSESSSPRPQAGMEGGLRVGAGA
jgi:LAO/AO transport system kinase